MKKPSSSSSHAVPGITSAHEPECPKARPWVDSDEHQLLEPVGYDFGLGRRTFLQLLGAGLMVSVSTVPALAQRRGSRGGTGVRNIDARVHLGKDGSITVLTGKVEAGQGARAELTQAAAEELRVSLSRVTLVMADTGLVPDDGITAGSGTTPRTVPAVRRGAAAARQALLDFAASRWGMQPTEIKDGMAIHPNTKPGLSYADLAKDEEAAKNLQKALPEEITLTSVGDWKILGKETPRPNARDIVTGAHRYPSDVVRPGMMHGKILRPASFGARLSAIDLDAARKVEGVVVVRDGDFVGVAATTTSAAEEALDILDKSAHWEPESHPPSDELFDYLKTQAQGGVPVNPFTEELGRAHKTLRQDYQVAYAQHAPLEPRAAVAEWNDGDLKVWLGTQNPFGCRGELARAFHIPEERVRVIVPDFGSGYGGKHTGEVGIEAARLAQKAGRPVSLRWTRREEFTWAYFRPAALIHVEATLDNANKVSSWHFVNINSGGAGVETPYAIAQHRSVYVPAHAPLRQGSYRALAATANHFARESFMDELAAAANADPLEFRLAHLENSRLRAVLETAAARFGWKSKSAQKRANYGVGLACGTEKGSFVAACVEIRILPPENRIEVQRVSQVFECGAILNPSNLLSQVQGAIIMGIGPALREQIRFEKGQVITASFRRYEVPRFSDVPELDVHLLNRPDLQPAGAGETPIIAIAPAIANAVFHATGVRVRGMPIKLPA